MSNQKVYDKETKKFLNKNEKKWIDRQRLYQTSHLYNVPFIRKIVEMFDGKIILSSIKKSF